MITIIRKTSDSCSQIEIIDGERGVRSVVAEINSMKIAEEHGSAEEMAAVICDAITKYLNKKIVLDAFKLLS